ncbi:AUR protein kinase [Aphanomyces invadans]|uniref:Aurora kinase n=1 Tax=Aphanomyces invadans TaxID=157072 RepID=A0A024UXU4_9STRA|nr:AUR protein kinase [Aphanomyces invadans]ETW10513.1 AUR protein kinase [Aphanomyces invadans]|eukprot:XP_008861924.1 AUR protein kinase [Aphanomyces invadans]
MDMHAKLEEWRERKRKREEEKCAMKIVATRASTVKKVIVSKLRAPSTFITAPFQAKSTRPLPYDKPQASINAGTRIQAQGALHRHASRDVNSKSGRVQQSALKASLRQIHPSISSHERKQSSPSSTRDESDSSEESASPPTANHESVEVSSNSRLGSLGGSVDAPRRVLNKKRLSYGEVHGVTEPTKSLDTTSAKLAPRSNSVPALTEPPRATGHGVSSTKRLSSEAILDALAKQDSPTRVLRRVSLDAPASTVKKPREDRRASYDVTPSKDHRRLSVASGGGPLRVLAKTASDSNDSEDDDDDDILGTRIPEEKELHAKLRRNASSSRLSLSRVSKRNSLEGTSRGDSCHIKTHGQRTKMSLEDFKYTDKKLGFGKFGYVYLAKQKTVAEKEVALKVLTKTNMDEVGVRGLKMEVEIQSRLKHPHILRLYRYFHEDSLAYLVLEYAPHGSLQKLLSDQAQGYFEEAKAASFVLQIVSAVQYLHARHVMHRDIKPENLLLGSHETIKVADFGLAIHAPPPNVKRRHFCGTPEYMSPEIIDDQEYSVEVDVWSVGIVAYELLVGHTPFRGEDTFHNIKTWYTQKLQRPELCVPGLDDCGHVSPLAKEFLHGLLAPAPSRWSLDQARRHPWLADAATMSTGDE